MRREEEEEKGIASSPLLSSFHSNSWGEREREREREREGERREREREKGISWKEADEEEHFEPTTVLYVYLGKNKEMMSAKEFNILAQQNSLALSHSL